LPPVRHLDFNHRFCCTTLDVTYVPFLSFLLCKEEMDPHQAQAERHRAELEHLRVQLSVGSAPLLVSFPLNTREAAACLVKSAQGEGTPKMP
jgi:hypothetical protein